MTPSIGIDYSMTSPAACKYVPEQSDITFWFAHATKYTIALPQVTTIRVVDDTFTTYRAVWLAMHCLEWMCQGLPVERVFLEDYAYAATGKVFHIGENTGTLKFFLHRESIPIVSVPPTVIKKFAAGKGNVDKPKMVAAFLEAYPLARQWIPLLYPRTSGVPHSSPLADLADAYWIARYGAEIS